MRHLVVKVLLLVSVILVGCNTDDEAPYDELIGSWELSERRETSVFAFDPSTGWPYVNTVNEFDGVYSLTFQSNGSVIRYEQAVSNLRIDSGSVNLVNGDYLVDFGDFSTDYRVDVIDASTIHTYYSHIDPVCGGVNFRDIYTKVEN